ncbi:hypothetical protein diail_859 [Diaporthe ilicicola]|nr:hypothetical protein diail_859 [Diaporthe ilicicola]
MPSPKIAIIGAGPVGTTLGRLLLRQSPSTSITIFESEPSPDYRSQGGTLDLHTDTGLAAIKEAGLWDEFMKHARYDGESLLMTDKNLKPFWQVKPSPSPQQKGGHVGGQRPEIDRAALREMLIESLPADMITWGHRLRELQPGKEPRSTKLIFTLADGGTTTASGFDLIVGADGAWSKVRAVLSDVEPMFSGVSNQAFEIPDAANTAPEVYRTVNRGSVFSHADGHKTNLQQMGDGSIVVYLNFRTDDEDWFKHPARSGFDAWDLEEAKAAALQRYGDWHPVIRDAISRTQGRTMPRSLYMLPVGFSFEHRPGLTILGDAAHLMTPFAGEGVNVGMEDARRLARAVTAAGADLARLDCEVAAFERDMFVRAGEFAALTETMLKAWFFTEDCPRSVVPKALSTHASFHAPFLLKPLRWVNIVGHDTHAIESYGVFSLLRAEGAIPPGVRFQPYQAALEPAYEAALLRDLRRIEATVPPGDLAVQWDCAIESAILEGTADNPALRPWFAPPQPHIDATLGRLRRAVDARAELGFHLCYGDIGRQHFCEPRDMGLLADVAWVVFRGVGRPVAWVYLPVPRGRVDDAYFAPLGTLARIEAASRVLGSFGVATECGMGRTPPEHFDCIVAISAAVSVSM